jgi:hypothetical protein
MISRKALSLNEKLNRAGRFITRASVLSDDESSAAASAPYLFSRVRARIASENERREAGGVWAGFWLTSKKAIPAMVITAAVSFGLSVYMAGNKSANSAFSVDAYLGTNDSDIESLVFAERRPLTSEEVLATIIGRDEREEAR